MDLTNALKEHLCRVCKAPLLQPLGGPVRGYTSRINKGSKSIVGENSPHRESDRYAPIVYYFGCKHWIHQGCVRNLLTHPSSLLCGMCTSNHMGVGAMDHSIQRLRGIERGRQITSRSTIPSESAHVRTGSHHAYDLGDNFLINNVTRTEIDRAEMARRDETKHDHETLQEDIAMFQRTFDMILDALNGDITSSIPRDVSLARQDSEQQRELLGAFFSDESVSLWSFIDTGGNLEALIAIGATWDQLCSWGLGEIRTTDVGFGKNNTRFLWPGYNCVPYLCAPPIQMNFIMFFKDVCKMNFDTLGRLQPPAVHLERMGFSFIRHFDLFLQQPYQGLKAIEYLTTEVCSRKFMLSRKMIAQLRERDTSPQMIRLINDNFNSWQLV